MNTKKLLLRLTVAAQAVAVLVISGVLSSCNSDNPPIDEGYLNKAETATAFQTIKGNHEGVLYWATTDANGRRVSDSTAVSLNIVNDSTALLEHFPSRAFAEVVPASNAELKAALKSLSDTTLTIRTRYTGLNPLMYQADPLNLAYNVKYGGSMHRVELAFYVGMRNTSYAVFDPKDTFKLQMAIVLAALFPDRKGDYAQDTYLKVFQEFYYHSKD